MQINPEEDGITHINVYSKGKTSLGRFLSNFTNCSILTEDGYFASIEGYWYWLLCDSDKRDKLKKLSGFLAKKVGRELKADDWCDDELFQTKIKTAILIKINATADYFAEFRENKLPFKHYYNYSGKVIEPKECKWIVDFLNDLRGFNEKV